MQKKWWYSIFAPTIGISRTTKRARNGTNKNWLGRWILPITSSYFSPQKCEDFSSLNYPLYVSIASTAPFLMLKSPLDHVSAPWDGDHITTEHRITLQLCKMPWQKACHSACQFFQISPIISNQSNSIMSMCIVKYLQSPPIIISIIISYPNLGVTWCPPCTSSTTLPSAQIVTVPSAFCKCLEWSPRRLSLFRSHHFGGLIYINC